MIVVYVPPATGADLPTVQGRMLALNITMVSNDGSDVVPADLFTPEQAALILSSVPCVLVIGGVPTTVTILVDDGMITAQDVAAAYVPAQTSEQTAAITASMAAAAVAAKKAADLALLSIAPGWFENLASIWMSLSPEDQIAALPVGFSYLDVMCRLVLAANGVTVLPVDGGAVASMVASAVAPVSPTQGL